jgi:hypothetical protein
LRNVCLPYPPPQLVFAALITRCVVSKMAAMASHTVCCTTGFRG